MSNINKTDAEELNNWLKSGEAILIDVREPLEYKISRIQKAVNIPLSKICLQDVVIPEHKNKKIVIQCRSGARSMSACEKIIKEDPTKELWNLEGGILAWEEAGFKVITDASILPLDRQVQLTLGILITFGVTMSYFISPAWLLIPAIIGLGLINAGSTGWCGMAKFIALFPWNRNK